MSTANAETVGRTWSFMRACQRADGRNFGAEDRGGLRSPSGLAAALCRYKRLPELTM